MRVARMVAAGVLLASGLSAAEPAKGLSPAEIAKIDAVSDVFVKAALARDWDTVAGLYLADAVVNPPNEPAARGAAAIRAWLERFPPLTGFTLEAVAVEGRDDLAYVLGTYAMTMRPPGAQGVVKDSGKYVEIRRRQRDGRWLIAVDIFNSDLPAAPPVR